MLCKNVYPCRHDLDFDPGEDFINDYLEGEGVDGCVWVVRWGWRYHIHLPLTNTFNKFVGRYSIFHFDANPLKFRSIRFLLHLLILVFLKPVQYFAELNVIFLNINTTNGVLSFSYSFSCWLTSPIHLLMYYNNDVIYSAVLIHLIAWPRCKSFRFHEIFINMFQPFMSSNKIYCKEGCTAISWITLLRIYEFLQSLGNIYDLWTTENSFFYSSWLLKL